MMKEIPNISQYEGEPFRRWFWSEKIDLTVWYENESIVGFQLCYKQHTEEKALTWKADSGFTHDTVDDGENVQGGIKQTPILVPDGAFDNDRISAWFKAEAGNLDPDLTAFVFDKLQEVNI